MFIKVCGIIDQNQAKSLETIADYLGFIFYPLSKRYVENTPPTSHTKRTGVFVDERLDVIIEKISRHQLDMVQLHGSEDPKFCREIRQKTQVIKAFSMDEFFDFKSLFPYEGSVDYYLFDTKSPLKGGSGIQFDWSILQRYHLSTPFILSGGINPESVERLKSFDHPKLVGIDINSGFEIAPGNKDISSIQKFIYELKN